MPSWFNWKFLAYHAALCAGVALEVLLLPRPWNAMTAAITTIVVHEWTKVTPDGKYLSDFVDGNPLNGTLDVLSGAVGAAVIAFIWGLFH